MIGTALDLALIAKIPSLRGVRALDDYFLYFETLSEAETGIAALHEVAKEYELDINDAKTEVVLLPDSLEPRWKSDLRTLTIRDMGPGQAMDLLTLFDRAFEYSKQFPSDSVLTYAAKQTLSANIAPENWQFCESLLLRSALAEPTMLTVLSEAYIKFGAYHVDNDALANLLFSLCSYHAPLQQGNEVSWALWLAKQMSITIPQVVADKIAELEDDAVALISLDLRENGLFDASSYTRWESHMGAVDLYENHWLLTYEAHEHGWLPSIDGSDYIAGDGFFSILRQHGVRFYGAGVAPTSSFFAY